MLAGAARDFVRPKAKRERLVVMNMYSPRSFGGAAGAPHGAAASGPLTSTAVASVGLAAGDINDETRMEQIRELLHGELKRHHDARILALETRMRELETGIFNQLDALHTRLDALSGDMMNVRREQLDELARGFVDMGERVRRLTAKD
jgi:hypothetical protein